MFSRQDEGRWAVRWLGGSVERLSSERRRELIEAAAARGRMSSHGALVRLRENLLPVMQTAGAATELETDAHRTSLCVLVAYTQATAADLLRALGIDRDPAHERVAETARAATSETAHPALR